MLTGGAIGKQPELRFLDAVLGFAPTAIQIVVEFGGRARKIGDDVARIVALLGELEPGDHAPLGIPGLGGIAKLEEFALLLVTHPVRGATLIGNGPDALTRVAMIGNDICFKHKPSARSVLRLS